MVIYFGLELDQLVFPEHATGGHWYCGPNKLLTFFEHHLGLIGHPNNNDFLRTEQFRQAIQRHITIHPDAFYVASFQADPLATATALLEKRDELMLAGWDFIPHENTPIRLTTIAQIDNIAENSAESLKLSPGFSDRWRAIEKALRIQEAPIDKLLINEPIDILPSHFRRVFHFLEKEKNIPIQQITSPIKNNQTDLGLFKKCLSEPKKNTAQKDGSIIILKAKRVHSLATFVAKFLEKNRNYQPLCLIPEKNRTIDNALIQEGLPSLGILSESLARPSLQILKLVTAFLWKPIDPYKILEFVALKVKPLADFEIEIIKDEANEIKERKTLSSIISRSMSSNPGLGNNQLRRDIKQYFEVLEVQASSDEFRNIEKDYKFWFSRDRYDISKNVPRDRVREIFEHIARWAKRTYDNDKNDPTSMLVLGEQAKRIVELIDALPSQEQSLSNLELERIVRTIYEPSPVSFKNRQVGHLNYVHHSSALIEPTSELLWWNFLDSEPAYFFSKWYQKELKYLKELGVHLDTPRFENARLLFQRTRPILYTNNRIIFCLPTYVDGKEVHPHPLLGNLDACFENLDALTVDIDKKKNLDWLTDLGFDISTNIALKSQPLSQPKPYLNIDKIDFLEPRDRESYTSLDALLYYPYKWVFQYKLDLHRSSILSVVKDHTLMGNLAHRVFEFLFRQKKNEVLEWDTSTIIAWVEKSANDLMVKEGAVLLMYGREPDRTAFVNKLKFAACTLIDMIRNNGWKIVETEKRLEDTFLNIEIKGIADLVLENEKGELAVIDLKWRGSTRRFNQIRNGEDLQLVLYSSLLMKNKDWAHTAFFIMEQGKMIARNNLAFKEAVAVAADENHIEKNREILDKMKATYQWRLKEFQQGKIEIRTKQTLLDLEEEITSEEIMALLEMKSDNAPFDDFKTLIGLLE